MANKPTPISILSQALAAVLRRLFRTHSSPHPATTPTISRARSVPPRAPTSTSPIHEWPELGEFAVEAVGESHYQPVLRIAAEQFALRPEAAFAVTLRLDNHNAYDPKAVALLIDGHLCGYLSREDARAYRRRLSALRLGTRDAIVGAQTTGGFELDDGTTAMIGLVLDLEPFDD